MINFDFYCAVSVYVLLAFGALIVIWLFEKKGKDKDLSLDPRFIWFCSVCSYTYINTKEDLFSECPRCGSYNKK